MKSIKIRPRIPSEKEKQVEQAELKQIIKNEQKTKKRQKKEKDKKEGKRERKLKTCIGNILILLGRIN